MKKSILRISIYVAIATGLTVVLLSSCISSRVGCPGPQQHWVGCGGYR